MSETTKNIKTHEELKEYLCTVFVNDRNFYAGFYRGYCAAMGWTADLHFIYDLMDNLGDDEYFPL